MRFKTGQIITLSDTAYRLETCLSQASTCQVWSASTIDVEPPGPRVLKLYGPLCGSTLYRHSLRRISDEIALYFSLSANLRRLFIPVYGHGYVEESYGYAMARMDTSLCGIRVEEAPPHRLSRLWLEIALSLHCLHRQGYLHLDLKPGNVLCNYDLKRFYLSDFGTIQLIDRPLPGRIIGTRGWIAPELYYSTEAGVRLNPATDIYGFGLLLYSLICQQLPQTHTRPGNRPLGLEDRALLSRQLMQLELNTPLRRQLETAIIRCLSRSPVERPASLAELLPLLCQLNHELGQARAVSPRQAAQRCADTGWQHRTDSQGIRSR